MYCGQSPSVLTATELLVIGQIFLNLQNAEQKNTNRPFFISYERFLTMHIVLSIVTFQYYHL